MIKKIFSRKTALEYYAVFEYLCEKNLGYYFTFSEGNFLPFTDTSLDVLNTEFISI